jgi:predicted transcriptional regulator YdeE
MHRTLVACLITLVFAGGSLAQAQQDKAGLDAEWTLSPMRLQEMPSVTYFHTSFKTSINGIRDADLGGKIAALFAAMMEAKVMPTGPMLMTYSGITDNPDDEITMTIGFPVAPGSQPAGNYQVVQLPAFKCAATVLSGNLEAFPQAYPKVYAELFGHGLTPTGELREFHLYWEDETSRNNMALIQVGVN